MQIREAVYRTLKKYGRDVKMHVLMSEVKKLTKRTPSIWTLYTYRSEWLKTRRVDRSDKIRLELLGEMTRLLKQVGQLLEECPAA